ncbi:unnamed protein product [Brassicogethes aeneus]|uniref:Phosphodiesterase n=1 Tax=Brassicogethes aeneus TaxID=1431903 RepID=A0A9P0AWU3_BRAAE|nr:unnamed protein product [Brassicogethes aeneus]
MSSSKESILSTPVSVYEKGSPSGSLKKESRNIKNEFPVDIDATDKAVKRVIAPYLQRQPKKHGILKTQEKKSAITRYEIKYKAEELFGDRKAFLSDFIDLPSVMWQSADVLKLVTNSTGITLYMVDEPRNEIYLVPKAIFNDRHKVNWKIQLNSTVAAYVVYKKEYVMLEDILNDDRFPNGLGYNDGLVKSVLAVPILTPEGDCFGVIEMHKDIFSDNYNHEDLKISILVASWMGTAIHQNRERVALQKQKKINECLLGDFLGPNISPQIRFYCVPKSSQTKKLSSFTDLIKCFFTSDLPLAKMIGEIMKLAKVSIKAEKGCFFVIEPESEELLADIFEEGIDEGMYKKNVKIKLTRDRGIAGLVARQKITIKLNDMYRDSKNKEIDDKTGFITRCIMSTPILSGGEVIGVVQVVNKSEPYEHFTRTDEDLFKVFSVYSALALHFDKLRQSVTKNVVLNRLYTDILLRHIGPCYHDLENLNSNLDVQIPEDFDSWSYQMNDSEYMPQRIIYMFKKVIGLNYLHSTKLNEFVLTVKKVHTNNYYHNIEHAFLVTHCVYNILIRNDIFTKIEQMGLMIAALTHDIHHRGVTNRFLHATNDNLSQLYNEYPQQNNNFKITMTILEHCQLFKNVTPDEQTDIYNEIKANIISTDSSAFFKCKQNLADKNLKTFDLKNEINRDLLKTLIMYSSEICCAARPFMVAKYCLNNLLKELFEQSDKEIDLGFSPISLANRDKEFFKVHNSLKFQTVIVIPCYEMLLRYLPNTRVLLTEAIRLREAFREILEMKGVKHWRPFESIVSKGN